MKLPGILMICLLPLACARNKKITTEDNWNLVQRNAYSYTTTKEGYVDSILQKMYRYKNGTIVDTVFSLEVKKYAGKVPSNHYWFKRGKNGAWQLASAMRFDYNDKGLLSSFSESKGSRLIQYGKITYDAANRRKEQLKIVQTNGDSTENGMDPGGMEFAKRTSRSGLDTSNSVYEYNQNGQVSKLLVTTYNKQPLMTEVNLYSGKDPVSSYVLDDKGDTIQRTAYSKDRVFEKREIQIKGHLITMWVIGPRIYQFIDEDLSSHVKTKQVYKYDQKGLLIEKRIYKAVANTQK